MKARWLIDMLHRSDLGGLDALVREDVRFRSPYADYAGRADVTHLIRLISQVLDDVRVSEGALAPEKDGPDPSAVRTSSATAPSRTTRFTATVDTAPVQGVLCEDLDASGRLVEAMLLLRPYRELRASMHTMSRLLDESPLPSVGA